MMLTDDDIRTEWVRTGAVTAFSTDDDGTDGDADGTDGDADGTDITA